MRSERSRSFVRLRAAACAALVFACAADRPVVAAAGRGPDATESSTAFYDAARGRMLVFGGRAPGQVWNSLWALSLDRAPRWTRITPRGTPPPPRYAHTMVYDARRDRLLVYGGTDDGIRAMSDVWELTLAGAPHWRELATENAPPGRYAHVAVYDPVGDRMIVFGGFDGSFLDDTWQLALDGPATWSRLAADGLRPAPRDFATAIYDPVGRRVVLFGGNAYGERTLSYGSGARVVERDAKAVNDTWALTLGTAPAWRELDPTGEAPGPRLAQESLYDAKRHRMIVMGGTDAVNWKDDAFALDLDGDPRWSAVEPEGDRPSVRSGMAFVYDAARDRAVFFAGKSLSDVFADVWALPLAGPPRWARLEPRPSTSVEHGWI